jgi:hypothetical protein
MRWALIWTVVAMATALPGDAFAAVLAPPGHAGAQQYFETIPTSQGDAAPPGSVGGTGNPSASSAKLAHFGQGRLGDQRLAKLGKDGQAAAGLAAASAPSAIPGVTGQDGKALAASSGAGGSTGTGVSNALTGSDAGGLGLLLPLLLATALIAALGVVIVGLRRRGSSPHAGV